MDYTTGGDTTFLNSGGKVSLTNLQSVIRPKIHEVISGSQPADPADLEEVLTQLLSYACAIEMVLARAAQSSTGTLPGHNVSVRGYVDQVFSGQAREVAHQRLAKYCLDAIAYFGETHQGVQSALEHFSKRVAEALSPAAIKSAAKPGGMASILGFAGAAYWKEFEDRYRHLDAAAVRQLVKYLDSHPQP